MGVYRIELLRLKQQMFQKITILFKDTLKNPGN